MNSKWGKFLDFIRSLSSVLMLLVLLQFGIVVVGLCLAVIIITSSGDRTERTRLIIREFIGLHRMQQTAPATDTRPEVVPGSDQMHVYRAQDLEHHDD